MRSRAALILLLLLPTVGAQAEPGSADAKSSRVEDKSGDVMLNGPTGSQRAPEGEYDHIDLTGAWIANETLTRLEVGVGVKRMAPSANPASAGRTIRIQFSIDRAEYNLTLGGCELGGSITWVLRSPGGGYSSVQRCVAVRADPEARAFHFVLPREFLVNQTSIPFGPSHEFRHFAAIATSDFPSSAAAASSAVDRAPDAGFGPIYRSPLANVTRAGALRLFSPEPIRVSNGESTTLVYPINLTNEGPAPATVVVSAQNPEPAWDVRVPSRLRVEAGATVTFPAILSMGFTHRHGEVASFRVRAEDAADRSSWSTIDLGVYWLETPQPAGHHDTVWAHSAGTSSSLSYEMFPGVPDTCVRRLAWINPMEKDPNPAVTQGPVAGCPVSTGGAMLGYPNRRAYGWTLPLSPSLLIGLDFDLSRAGLLKTSVSSRYPVQAQLEARVLYCDPTKPASRSPGCQGELVPLAEGKSAPRMLAAAANDFEIPLAPTPASDSLPYLRGSNLVLQLRLVMDRPPAPPFLGSDDVSPALAPAATTMTLPLVEYHDPIDQAFEALGSLHLRALGAFERPANPGDTILFPFELANRGARDQSVRLTMEGANVDWARLVGPSEMTISADESRNVTLAVEVPAQAAAGERAELFVVVESQRDPNVVALSRLRASVVDESVLAVEDEADRLGDLEGRESPGIRAIVVALALLGTVWLRRRQRSAFG